jgi:cytochrome c
VWSEEPPDENRFSIEVLNQKMNEPMQLAVRPDGKVIYIERQGLVHQYDPVKKSVKQIGKLNAYFGSEDGLLGVTLDPAFAKNNWIYFFYAPAGTDSVQRIARFTIRNDLVDLKSEKVLLEFPVIRACCHSGGSVEFGPDGNLFISTGDNTNPFASDGYAPIDERPGRLSWDAQKSSANPNDLRGKILRIKPNDDGTYSIPEGNLFPKGTKGTRPEIYVMGNRNPFRIAIDQKTGYLYWGEVGPDAGTDSAMRGPRGYDEVNQARKAGFFGWPYFVGNNKAYYDYDFAAQQSGKIFHTSSPINNSPNNKGIQQLPPAQPAFIWYPYDESEEFPLVGKGGRNAMAGPVFYTDQFTKNMQPFPAYYDGKLFIYDWMRNWIMAVTMDRDGNYKSMEPFLPSSSFSKPVDMQFGADGALYVLEYGSYWRSHNEDSRLIRIQYNAGNRKPVARIQASKTVGATPLTVHFSAANSFDYDDNDHLSYAWKFDKPMVQSKDSSTAYTFKTPGIYKVQLEVRDAAGEKNTATMELKIGNEPPIVNIETVGNSSFYYDNAALKYRVRVSDREDGKVDQVNPSAVRVSFDYLPEGSDIVQTALGNNVDVSNPYLKGKALIDKSDCKACHALNKTSVGPSYTRIASRYKGKQVVNTLVTKIIKGGSGNWGEQPMSAHPQLSKADAEQMVRYILNLSETKKAAAGSLPLVGTVTTNKHKGTEGTYFLSAAYTDKGSKGIKPIAVRQTIRLRHPVVPALSSDSSKGVMRVTLDNKMRYTEDASYIVFRQIDLRGIGELVFKASSANIDGNLELRLGSPTGKLVSSVFIDPDASWREYTASVEAVNEPHDLYFVFKVVKGGISIWNTFDLSTIEFRRRAGTNP